MLDALGGPGERSILSQRKREEEDESGEDRESREDSGAEEAEAKRRKEDANNHGGHEEARTNSEENLKEESRAKDTRGELIILSLASVCSMFKLQRGRMTGDVHPQFQA